MKEITGHNSDAIDTYQITSDYQKEECSKVLSAPIDRVVRGKVSEEAPMEVETNVSIPVMSSIKVNGVTTCSCNKTYSKETANLATMLSNILEGGRKGMKATVKIEIEFEDK